MVKPKAGRDSRSARGNLLALTRQVPVQYARIMYVFVDDSSIDLVPPDQPRVRVFTYEEDADKAFKESILKYLSPYQQKAEELFAEGMNADEVYWEMSAGDNTFPSMFIAYAEVE
jgi:hypothetical protein